MLKGALRVCMCGAVLATILGGLGGRSASGAPLEAYAPDRFEVTVRVNARVLLDHPLLEPLRLAHQKQMNEVAGLVQLITGVDLRKDIDAILLAGYLDEARKDEGVVLIQGRWDAERLVSVIRANEKFEEIRCDGRDVYGFWDDNKQHMTYGAFLAGDVMILGPREGVEAAVAAGQTSLADHGDFGPALSRIDDGALVRVIARRPARIDAGKPGAALIRSLKVASLVISMQDGIQVELRIEAADAETAATLNTIAQGALALGRVAQEKPGMAWLVRKVELTGEETVVEASLHATQAEIDQLIDAYPLLKRLMGRPE